MPEKWEKVAGYRAYEVSSDGRVRNVETGKEKATPVAKKSGYKVVNLWVENRGRVHTVHSLVAAAFLGPMPEGWSVNHIDGDKLNNDISNLEYMTLADNSRHQARIGLGAKGERSGNAKLTETEVREIYARAHAGERTGTLANLYGVQSPIISQIKAGTRWRHLNLAKASASLAS